MSLNIFWINSLIINGSICVIFLLLLEIVYFTFQSNLSTIRIIERLLIMFVFMLWLFVLFCAITVQSIIG